MFEEQSQQTTSPITTVRIGVSLVLLALAVPLGIWVINSVNATINGEEIPPIVQKIIPDETTPVDINTPAGKIELPKKFFNGFSYFILYLFLLIPTTIAIALVKGSVALLSPDISRQMRQLVESIRKSVSPKQ
jgi:hypothetical protein